MKNLIICSKSSKLAVFFNLQIVIKYKHNASVKSNSLTILNITVLQHSWCCFTVLYCSQNIDRLQYCGVFLVAFYFMVQQVLNLLFVCVSVGQRLMRSTRGRRRSLRPWTSATRNYSQTSWQPIRSNLRNTHDNLNNDLFFCTRVFWRWSESVVLSDLCLCLADSRAERTAAEQGERAWTGSAHSERPGITHTLHI